MKPRLMRFFFSCLLVFLSSYFPAVAAAPNITEFRLKNGMEVVLIEDKHIPAISHNLLFRIGAADDPRGQSGLAHYLEHMLFQGTKNYKPNEYSHLIANQGGQTNAFTSADYTGYWVNIAKDKLPLVLKLEADRLQYLSPPQADFDKEKKVILEERRMRVDNNPAGLFSEQMNALLFYHHPYGTPIIGWANEMEVLNRDTVMQYYRDYYHPANAVLVLAGDIDPAKIRPQLEKFYGAIPARKSKPAPRLQEPPQLGARRFTMRHAQVNQPEWMRSYVSPSYNWNLYENLPTEREALVPAQAGSEAARAVGESEARGKVPPLIAFMLAEQILGGSKTSRLYRRLVEEEKLATSASASFNPFVLGAGEFSIGVTPIAEKDLPEIEKIVEEELQKLHTTPPSDEELARAKTLLIASNVYLQDGLQSLAQVMGHLKMIGLPLTYYSEWESQIKPITAQQVSAALSLLDENYSVTGALLPEKSAGTGD